ncbi:SdpI family protein [Massilia sp. TWR1-2-2]|uniref:SdpI family protein n=1 Tax=Massilia sp. TWR1-2-2 TaxID=2804584 RepID=UPI003CED197F
MKNRYLLMCALVVLVTVAFTLALYSKLPATIPTHWNGAGAIDGYGPRSYVFIHTALMVLLMLVWTVLPSLSPARFKVDTFSTTYWYICFVLVALLGYFQCVMVWGAYSPSMPINTAVFGGSAVFFGLLGNVMGKVRRNFWIGIRTPWTLASERVWYSTHRFAAKTIFTGAGVSLIGVLAGVPLWLCLTVLLAGPIVPAFYSLFMYRRFERSGNLEA